MRLITQKQASEFPKVGTFAFTDEGDIVITAKFYAIVSAVAWLVAEFDPRSGVMFAYSDFRDEGIMGGAGWNYEYIQEVEAITFMGIPRVEVDKDFTPRKFSECVDKDGRIIV